MYLTEGPGPYAGLTCTKCQGAESPAYAQFNFKEMFRKVLEIKERYLSYVGRGIPYKCSFCPKRESFITTMLKEL